MKRISVLMVILGISGIGFSQTSGKITYKETVKMDYGMDEGMDQEMIDMLPKSQSMNKQLLFIEGKSLFQNAKNNANDDMELESDDGGMKIVIKQQDSEDIFYCDQASREAIMGTSFMGKDFRIVEEIQQFDWKLTGEQVKYLGYVCNKAIMNRGDEQLVAWFTPQIPAPVGPDVYNQLPGAILMLSINDGEIELMATKVELFDVDPSEIKPPKKGKKVTPEEYDAIVDEKMREMEAMKGDNRVIIRR